MLHTIYMYNRDRYESVYTKYNREPWVLAQQRTNIALCNMDTIWNRIPWLGPIAANREHVRRVLLLCTLPMQIYYIS